MPKAESQGILYQRSLEPWAAEDLQPEAINKIMEIEENETTILKWQKDEGCVEGQSPASCGKWWFKQGNCITLAELCYYAHQTLTLYDTYQLWLSLPRLINKRFHSESQAPGAQHTRNAKMLKKMETGRYGLNERGREPARRQRRS